MEPILLSLSQVFTTHNPNVFTPILSLSEGRAGIAWLPSNKMFFLPPSDIKRLSLSPQIFSLYFLGFKGFKKYGRIIMCKEQCGQ
jgi:hypothetical protein